jgi:hypothetical protein
VVTGKRAEIGASVGNGLRPLFSQLLGIPNRRPTGPWLQLRGPDRFSSYLVKINLIPAMISTVAKHSEIMRTAKRLLPKCEPMMPPIIAAGARTNPSDGTLRTFVK